MDDGRLDALGQTIVGALPGAATGHSVAFNQLTVTVEAEKIVEVVRFLRDDRRCRFVNFTDVTAVDYPGREKRFDVVYHFLSPTLNDAHPSARRRLTRPPRCPRSSRCFPAPTGSSARPTTSTA